MSDYEVLLKDNWIWHLNMYLPSISLCHILLTSFFVFACWTIEKAYWFCLASSLLSKTIYSKYIKLVLWGHLIRNDDFKEINEMPAPAMSSSVKRPRDDTSHVTALQKLPEHYYYYGPMVYVFEWLFGCTMFWTAWFDWMTESTCTVVSIIQFVLHLIYMYMRIS